MINISIIGPGLLGGSVALASKELNLVDKISLWVRRSDAISELVEADIADYVSDDFQEIITDADTNTIE